jgi:hypothetical protein
MTKKQKIRYQQWLAEYRRSLMIHFSKRIHSRVGPRLYEADYFAICKHFSLGVDVPNFAIEKLAQRDQMYYTRKKRVWYKVHITAYRENAEYTCWILYDTEYKQLVTALEGDADPICENTYKEYSKETEWENNWRNFQESI